MGEVIYLAQRAPTRPEAPDERIERLVKEAAANWTDAAVLQRAWAAREAKLSARPLLRAALPGDFMSSLSPDQRAFVGEVARDVLRNWGAGSKPKALTRKPKDGVQ